MKINIPTALIGLLLISIASADYVCVAKPITPIPNVQSSYIYGQPVVITVDITGVDYGYTIGGIVKDENGNVVEDIPAATWIDTDTVSFSFSAIDKAGTYKFYAYLQRPIQPFDLIYSDTKTFLVKSPLDVTFSIDDLNQYTTKDITFSLKIFTPSGGIISTTKTLEATIDGQTKTITPTFVDTGGGSWKVTIPKENLAPGTMNVKLVVTDPKNQYEPITKEIKGINIMRPAVIVSVSAPQTTEVNEWEEIRVTTADVTNQPMDVDTLKLTIRKPTGLGSVEYRLSSLSSDFVKAGTGTYTIQYQFTTGGSYSFHAIATKELYTSGANSYDPITVVSGDDVVECDVSSACDPNCPDDPDCQSDDGIPITYIIIGVCVLAAGFIFMRRR